MVNKTPSNEQKIIDFLSNRGRTKEEIAKKLHLSEREINKLILKKFNGFEFYIQQTQIGEEIYRLIVPPLPLIIPKRIWTFAKHTDPKKPYIWIQFPSGLNWKKIINVPLSDLQWGADDCDEKQIREYVEWIEKTPNVFCFLNGDILNNALANSPGGSVYWDKMRPRIQVQTLIELLRPIAHKILWAQPGNHEERTIKLADIDPLYWIARTLDIPYYNQPLFANILWEGHTFNFYSFHGFSGSRTEGGKLNAAARPIEWTEFIMFYVMGHVHTPMGNPITRRCIFRKHDEKGKIKELRIVDRDQYVIIAAAWMEFWNSYAAKAGYSPPPQGGVPCFLLANGGYEISE